MRIIQVFICVQSFVIKCFGITNTPVQNFDVQISSVKTVPKCLHELKVLWTNVIIDVFTPCDNHLSKILQNYCDIVSHPSFCTFTCNETLYTVTIITLRERQGDMSIQYLKPIMKLAESWAIEILNTRIGIPSSLPQCGDLLFFSFLSKCTNTM